MATTKDTELSAEDRVFVVEKIREIDKLKGMINEGIEQLSKEIDRIDRARKYVTHDTLGLKLADFEAKAEAFLPTANRAIDYVAEHETLLAPIRHLFPEANDKKLSGQETIDQPASEAEPDSDQEFARSVMNRLADALDKYDEMTNVEIHASDKTAARLQLMNQGKGGPGKRAPEDDDLKAASEKIEGMLDSRDDNE